MHKTVLITGGFGFLGRAVAQRFKQLGYRVVGVGRGRWGYDEALAHGFDIWLDASVSLSSLMALHERFEIVVHCAGNGSVGYSLTNPLQDFYKSVTGTAELLEYLRLSNPSALLIYPSSAGVYGAKDDAPIKESDSLAPISPYGFNKKIAEELCESYSKNYGLRVVIIRFFSIYGPGLTKQLLWDASKKLLFATDEHAVFWGTGQETRDWIYSEDAADLIVAASRTSKLFILINGASGLRVSVRETLILLKNELDVDADIVFNGTARAGDPLFYHADISNALALGWKPARPFLEGLGNYVVWLTNNKELLND